MKYPSTIDPLSKVPPELVDHEVLSIKRQLHSIPIDQLPMDLPRVIQISPASVIVKSP